jgi:hypothetical protein
VEAAATVSDEQVVDDQDVEEPSRLRRQLQQAQDELATLRARDQQRTIIDAGYDPQLGVVRALAEQYAKQPDVEWTRDGFRAFAQSQGLPPPAPPAEQTQQPTPEGTPQPTQAALTPEEQVRLAGQGRLDQLNTASLPDQTPTLAEQIMAAEQGGNWAEAERLKNVVWAQRRREGVPDPLNRP